MLLIFFRVHAIIVCCPTAMHEAHVKNALKYGKLVKTFIDIGDV